MTKPVISSYNKHWYDYQGKKEQKSCREFSRTLSKKLLHYLYLEPTLCKKKSCNYISLKFLFVDYSFKIFFFVYLKPLIYFIAKTKILVKRDKTNVMWSLKKNKIG